MKKLYVFYFFILLFPLGCSNQVDPIEKSEEPASFEMNIDMTQAPSEVVRLAGLLSHRTYEEIKFDFQFEGDSAKANVKNIPSGTWQLEVYAYNDNGVALYSGSTLVNIMPGIVNIVRLHLNPSTGELLINVTWGNMNFDAPMVIGHYPLNSNLKDYSGYSHDGRLFDAIPVEDRFGNKNSALYFDGVDDYGIVPHYPAYFMDIHEISYSISFWVKSSGPGKGRVISKWNEHLDTAYPFSFQMNDEMITGCSYDTIGIATVIEYGDIWDGDWHHLVFIMDSKSMLQTGYLDGEFVISLQLPKNYSTANYTSINIANRPLHSEYYYQGYIDDIYIFNYAISSKEIKELYQTSE